MSSLAGRRQARTTADGHFGFDGLKPGEYTLTARAQSFPEVVRMVALRGGEVVEGLEIRLEVGSRSGTIYGSVTGVLAGETAGVYARGVSASVAADGTYELRGVPAADEVWVSARTGARSLRQRTALGVGDHSRVDFVFEGTARLFGSVSRAGHPNRARTPVDIMSRSGGARAVTFVSAQGRYDVNGLDGGDYLVTIGSRRFEVEVTGQTRFDVDLCGDDGGRFGPGLDNRMEGCAHLVIGGRVLTEDGVGIQGVRVRLTAFGYWRSDWTDSNGAFSFADIRAGNFVLGAHHPSIGVGMHQFSADESVEDLVLQLRRAQSEVVVARETGTEKPLRGPVTVHVFDGSNLLGVFFLGGKAPGDFAVPLTLAGYDLTFSHRGHHPVTLPVWNGYEAMVELRPCGPDGQSCDGVTDLRSLTSSLK